MKPNTTRILTIIFSRNLGLNFRTSLHDINNWLLLKGERIRKECYGYLKSYKPTTTVDHIIISSLWFAIDYHPFVTCVESCRIWIMAKSNFHCEIPRFHNNGPMSSKSLYMDCPCTVHDVPKHSNGSYGTTCTCIVLVPSWCMSGNVLHIHSVRPRSGRL